MKGRLRFGSLLLGALCLGAVQAETVNLNGTTRIVGKACKSTDFLVSPDNLESASNGIIKAINANTVNAQIDNAKIVGHLTKMFDYMSRSNKTQLEQFGAAQERARAENEFGVQRRLESDCESPSIGGAALQGDLDKRRLVVYNDRVMQQYNRSALNAGTAVINAEELLLERRALLKELAGDSPTNAPLPADLLFPRGGSIPDEQRYQQASAAYIAMLTNPFPDPDLSESEREAIRDKPADLRKYHVLRSLKDDRLSLSQRMLSEIESANTATIPTQGWGDSLWQEMGGEGPLPGKVNDKVSQMHLFDLLTNARFANENYLVAINQNNSTGLLQRMLQIQIVNSRMMFEMLKTQRQMLALESLRDSSEARSEFNGILADLRQKLENSAAKRNVGQ